MISQNINTILRSCIFILLLFFVCLSVNAQSDSTQVTTTAVESVNHFAPVDFRVPSEDKIIEFQKDSRFQYGDTFTLFLFLEKILNWIADFLDGAVSTASKVSGIGEMILYILATILIIVIVVFIVLKIKGIKLKTLLEKKKIDTPEIEIYTENVNEMNFDTLLSNALSNKDYRLATRFLYLKNLKLLSDKTIIKWNINKTNYSYQHEIQNSGIRSKFLETTFIFDYIWYGEFPVDEYQYSIVENRMTDFNKMVSNEK